MSSSQKEREGSVFYYNSENQKKLACGLSRKQQNIQTEETFGTYASLQLQERTIVFAHTAIYALYSIYCMTK